MKNDLFEKCKRLLLDKRQKSWQRLFTVFLSVLILTGSFFALALPAITEQSANFQAKNGETTYSSHLEDFVTGVVILDANGNEVPQNGSIYVGEDYEISISFSENNISGQEKQFVYNEDGYLTYQIPALFDCPPVTNGLLSDADGDIVGNYTIDENGLLRVWFIPGYIDSTKASLTLSFHSTAGSSQGGGLQKIDFGGYSIDVYIYNAGILDVQKTAGNYDARTHSIEYEVKVEAKVASVDHIVFTDTPLSSGLTVDPNSIVYTSLDGQTVYPSAPTSLDAGEGFLVRYRAYLSPSLYQGKSNVDYNARNRARVTGTNDDGPITAEDTAEKYISTRFLKKIGTDEPSNSRIRWTVIVGDGSTVVDGLTIRDIPGSGLTFDLAEGITAVPYCYSASGELLPGNPIPISFGSDPTRIKLPSGVGAYGYVLTYYTKYSLESGVMSADFQNTVTASDTQHGSAQVTQTVTAHAVGAPPEISKTVEKTADGTALHYIIEAEVPGIYGGTSGFYLSDSYTKVTLVGEEYFFGQEIENLTVYTVDSDGQTRVYAPYTGGNTARTYLLYCPDDPRSFSLYFNTASKNASASNWIETHDSVLRVEYDLPLSSLVDIRPDGVHYVVSEGITVGDLIAEEMNIKNLARLYYNDRQFYVDDDADYREHNNDVLIKKGEENEDGIIEYEVIFNNRDENNNTVLQKSMKELIFHDELLSPGMSYVDGSLFCDVYNSTLSRIRVTYQYGNPISQSSALSASAQYFTWYSGDHDYNTLYEYAQHSGIGGGSSSTSRLVFRYQVAVDRSSPQFHTSEPTVPLDNRARLTGKFPDNKPFDTDFADCTVLCDTEIINKTVEHTEGSNRAYFTITLNPAGIDLLSDITQMTVVDRMTENLQPVLGTVRVLYQINGEWQETTPQFTYDPEENTLTFQLRDDVPIRILYSTLILESGDVHIGNEVALEGYAVYSDFVDTTFHVNEIGGAAHSGNYRLTLFKQSSDTHLPLSNAVFALYGPQNSERQSEPPAGTPASITKNGQTLWYYTAYTTGPNGTVEVETNQNGIPMFSVQGLYAFQEVSAPTGYQLLAEPLFFYADEKPDGGLQDVNALLSEAMLTAANEPIAYLLPETGGQGIFWFMFCGIVLIAVGLIGLLFWNQVTSGSWNFFHK